MNRIIGQYYTILKENLAMIALIPTFLGALWQIFQLGGISIQMIRFFSLSQLINDGVIILLFFLVPLSILIFVLNIDYNELYSEDINLWQYLKENNKTYFLPFCLFTIFGFISLVFITEENVYYSFYYFFSFTTVYAMTQMLVFLQFFNFFKRTNLIEVYLGLTTLIVVIISLVVFSLNFKNIESIENFKALINKLEKKVCYSKEPKIVYYNDKYIFIELETKNKKSILIKKIDDLFVD